MSDLNNNIAVQAVGNLRVYNCGGGGIGVGKYFEPERDKINPGFARLHSVYMDTSKASTFGVPEEFFYQLPEKNGSGGIRKYNGPDIIRYTGEMLQLFPPMEHNVVIHTTTGGSGSVMGPSIASELLAQGKSVIVFAIGSDDTKNYIENTVGTMESYHHIAELREAGLVLQYLQNGVDGTIEEVDRKIHLAVSCLTVLYSGMNKNLDDRDVYNWSHFSEVTSYSPQVGVLSIHQGEMKLANDANLITVATLNRDLNNTRVGYPVEFQRVGVPLHIEDREDVLKFPLHFAVTDGYLDTVMKDLRRQLAEYDKKAGARVIRNNLSDGSKKVASNGLVF
jgi:hypothetical protein